MSITIRDIISGGKSLKAHDAARHSVEEGKNENVHTAIGPALHLWFA
jgi:hypothetical protein